MKNNNNCGLINQYTISTNHMTQKYTKQSLENALLQIKENLQLAHLSNIIRNMAT